MNSIFGILNKSEQSTKSIVEEAIIIIGDSNPNMSASWINLDVGIGSYSIFDHSASRGNELSILESDSGCHIVADARIDYKEDLVRELEIENAHTFSDSKLILLSYLKWKNECVNHLFGDFVFAIWDTKANHFFCGRDHFGVRPLYYINNSKYFAFCSDPKGFEAIKDYRLNISDQYIIDSICAIYPSKKYSAFRNIYRIEPANSLIVSFDQKITQQCYWELKIQEEFLNLTESEAINGLRDRFINAVKQRSYSNDPIGVELSGGLDSSSIVSCLRRIVNSNTHIYAFSHSLSENQLIKPPSFKSELGFSKKIVESSDLIQHFVIDEINCEGGYIAIKSALSNELKPPVGGYSMMSDLLYSEVHKSGATVLLSGFGGDEGVSNQGSGYFEELIQNKEFSKLRESLKASVNNMRSRYFRRLTRYYLYFVMPWMKKILLKDWRKTRFKAFSINQILLKKYQCRKRYFANVFIPDWPNVRHRQLHRLMHPHVSDRLENSYSALKAKKIEYRYPFIDVKLVEFYYSLNSDFKYKKGIGRYVFRMAMKDIVPDEVRNRMDKTGATIPSAMYRLVKDEAQFLSIIEEGRQNNQFHYVDYRKLEWILKQFCDSRDSLFFTIREFISPFCILLLQKWQREGKINIGIKC